MFYMNSFKIKKPLFQKCEFVSAKNIFTSYFSKFSICVFLSANKCIYINNVFFCMVSILYIKKKKKKKKHLFKTPP